MRRFLSAKSQVFRESGVSFKVITSLPLPLPSPEQLGLDQRARGGVTVETMQGRSERV